MKNLRKFLFALAIIFVPVVANAQEVSDEDTLKSCLQGATEDICVLQNNVDTNEIIYVNGKKTIDLNNKDLIVGQVIYLYKGEDLTITGSGNVKSASNSFSIFYLDETNTLTLESGTYENTGKYNVIDIIGGGTGITVNIKKDATLVGKSGIVIVNNDNNKADNIVVNLDGKIIAKNPTANGVGITTNGKITSRDTTKAPIINIGKNASITSDGVAIYAAGTAIWNINGGTFTGPESLSVKSGTLNISGGKFTATALENLNPDTNNNGTEPTGAALSITANSAYDRNVKVNITGGEFISKNSSAVFEGLTSASNTAIVELSISNGTFTGAEGKDAINVTNSKNSDVLNNFITGGTFSSEVKDEYRAKGFENIEVDGEVIVVKINDIEVIANEDGTITVDKNTAKYTDIVKVTVAPKEGYETKEIIVKDENGQIISISKENTFVMPNSKVTVSAVFTKVEVPTEPVIPEDPKNEEVNPDTGDTIVTSSVLGIISILGLGISLKTRKSN